MATREIDVLLAPTAFQRGAAYTRMQRERNNALAALLERYGPEAATPTEYGQLEGIRQRAELHPYAVKQAERTDAAMQANVDRYGAAAGDPTAVEIARNEEAVRMQALRNARGVLQMTKDNNGDPVSALDRIGGIFRGLGYPDEQFQQLRQHVANNPQQGLDELLAILAAADEQAVGRAPRGALSAGAPFYDQNGRLVWGIPTEGPEGVSLNVLEGYTPATAAQADVRLGQGDRRLTMQELQTIGLEPPAGYQSFMDDNGRIYFEPIQGSESEIRRAGLVAENEATLRNEIGTLERAIIGPNQTIQIEAQRALDIIRQHRAYDETNLYTRNLRSADIALGGDIAQLQAAIQGLVSNIQLESLANMDASLAPMSDSDREVLGRSLGNLDIINRSRAELVQDIERITNIYQRATERAQQSINARRQELQRIESMRDATPPPGARNPFRGNAGTANPNAASIAEQAEAIMRELGY